MDRPIGPPGVGRGGRRALIALVAILGGPALPGCVSPIDGGRGIPPLYESREDGGEIISQVHLWPLFSRTVTPARTETRALWPLFRDRIDSHQRNTRFLPIHFRWRYTRDDGSTDVQNLLVPVYWGRDSVEGRYFSVFPLGGTVKGILGLDRIDYVLFPLYARVSDRGREAHHILFPLIHWSSGERVRGSRFLPFYSNYRGYTPDGTLRYHRRSYLWPLIHLIDGDLETDDPTRTRWFWPLYGTVRSGRLNRWSVAWPLLGRDSYPHRERNSYYLFPLLRFSWEKGEMVQWDIYPLIGHSRSNTFTRDFLLWPLFGRESQEEGGYSRRARWFFPFYRHSEIRSREDPRAEVRTRIWPLYRYDQSPDGGRT